MLQNDHVKVRNNTVIEPNYVWLWPNNQYSWAQTRSGVKLYGSKLVSEISSWTVMRMHGSAY